MIKMKAIEAPLWSAKFVEREVKKAQHEFAKQAIKEHEEVTKYWETEVEFRAIEKYDVSREASVGIFTKSDVWRYVDKGTKPHIIRPKRKPVLAFRTPFSPKTTPRSLRTTRGYLGDTWVHAKEVHHPGTQPRQFSVMIGKKLTPVWARLMRAAILKGTEKGRMYGGR